MPLYTSSSMPIVPHLPQDFGIPSITAQGVKGKILSFWKFLLGDFLNFVGCFSGKGFPLDFLFQWKNNTPFFPSGKIFWNRLFPGNFHGKFPCFFHGNDGNFHHFHGNFHGKYPFWSATSTVCFDSWVPCLNKTLLSRNYEYFGFGFNLNVASKRSLCLETIMRLESFHLSRLKLCFSHFS